MVWLLLCAVVASVGGLVVFNRLVQLKNRAAGSWSDIDVQLKRRHDLVDNLVEAVKGYAHHERQVLERVTAARTKAEGARTEGRAGAAGAAESALSGEMGKLFALVEAYPDLKASERFADLADAGRVAAEVGYPVILKASAGGGGRGMRIVQREDQLESQFGTATEEARKAFGDGSIYLEKYLLEPRHIEFQVFGDRHGKVIHLGERECSIQRRHQKLLEEAPSPALTPELRAEMGDAAVRLAASVGYENAGTIEFLLDRGRFYFMEMNTRIQVEHPVTEVVTGLDLVKMQIEVAAGREMTWPGGLTARGHAIECRINAEDPEKFTPSPGRISTFYPPGGPGVRLDSHIYEDYVVPPHYDSLVAKLIASGRTRDEAIARMDRALGSFVIEGIKTSIPLHQRIVRDRRFQAGDLSTRFMERFLEDGKRRSRQGEEGA